MIRLGEKSFDNKGPLNFLLRPLRLTRPWILYLGITKNDDNVPKRQHYAYCTTKFVVPDRK